MQARLVESIQTRDKQGEQLKKVELELSSLAALDASKLEELDSLKSQMKQQLRRPKPTAWH